LAGVRFVEVYINADVTLNFTGAQDGTMKRILLINTGTAIRSIVPQIDGSTHATQLIGDGSTANTKSLYEMYSFRNEQVFAVMTNF
jgi:hypothetical protein